MFYVATVAELPTVVGNYFSVGPYGRSSHSAAVDKGRLELRDGPSYAAAALRAPLPNSDITLVVTEDSLDATAALAVLIGRMRPDLRFHTEAAVAPRLHSLANLPGAAALPDELVAAMADLRIPLLDRCQIVLEWVYTGKVATVKPHQANQSSAGRLGSFARSSSSLPGSEEEDLSILHAASGILNEV